MNSRTLAAAVALVLFGSIASGQTADSTLKAANGLYNAGAYESAELAARRLMEQGPIADSIRTQAEQIIAFSLVAQGKTDLAREHFESILSLNPSFELDPVLTSPKILTVFQEAKLRSGVARTMVPSPGIVDSPEAANITFRAVLFPGWEQYYRGRTTVGLALAGAGILTLGSGIAFEILRAPARKDYLDAVQPSDIAAKYQTYNRYYRGEVYSFIAFAAVYVASEFDVFLNHHRSVEIQPSLNPANGSGLVLTFRW